MFERVRKLIVLGVAVACLAALAGCATPRDELAGMSACDKARLALDAAMFALEVARANGVDIGPYRNAAAIAGAYVGTACPIALLPAHLFPQPVPKPVVHPFI